MNEAGWDYETLLTNGWDGQWVSGPSQAVLAFTYYRSELSVYTVRGHGATETEAIADAVAQANAWLEDHPGYRPRRPWITAHGLAGDRA